MDRLDLERLAYRGYLVRLGSQRLLVDRKRRMDRPHLDNQPHRLHRFGLERHCNQEHLEHQFDLERRLRREHQSHPWHLVDLRRILVHRGYQLDLDRLDILESRLPLEDR